MKKNNYKIFKVPPYTLLDKEYLHMDCGSENGLIKAMASYFNFSINFINYNKIVGQKHRNGSWTGLIGSLIDQVEFFFLNFLFIIFFLPEKNRK